MYKKYDKNTLKKALKRECIWIIIATISIIDLIFNIHTHNFTFWIFLDIAIPVIVYFDVKKAYKKYESDNL